MSVSIPHDEFLATYYDQATRTADITIASIIKKNGHPFEPAIDIESVKVEGALAGLERTFENFDANHESGAQLTTFLSFVVRNCVISELEKAINDAIKNGLLPPKKRKTKKETDENGKEIQKEYHITPGVKLHPNSAGPFEPHQYMEHEGWLERKEEVLKLLGKYMLRLPVNDQVILTHWAQDEKTYVEESLKELGIEKTPATANWVYGRKNKALKALKMMMGGNKPEYRDIYLPSAGRNSNSMMISDRNALRRHQYAAKAHVTRNINYKETIKLLAEKILTP